MRDVSELQPYACAAAQTRGRLFPEEETPYRTPFHRDRDRVIHATAFRRLKHKTQVFVCHEGDHYRTRLTHSLEVSQIARSVSYALGLNEVLTETLALAHDLGHTPFGHVGEDVLHAKVGALGGEFDHNVQTFRILTDLEHRYADFDGLNLSWETLEGIVKHNGPLKSPLHPALKAYNEKQDLMLQTYASAEAQVAALADDIAYNNHDLDDGLRSGMFEIEDVLGLPFAGDFFRDVLEMYPNLEKTRLIHESIRRMINAMVSDLITTTQKNIARLNPASADDIRHAGQPLVAFSDEMEKKHRTMKSFLMKKFYRHPHVMAEMDRAKRIMQELFDFFVENPHLLPPEWFQRIAVLTVKKDVAQVVSDYIAGMTDRYAIEEHKKRIC
ncbi:MAG: deoxyguanosinetriphosphate triphosphohydrolase [Alphaproteobacteria bacterium]